MMGMELMLKSMGLDPAAITQTIEMVATTAKAMKEQMDRIEKKLDALSIIPGNSATENSGEKND